ncbi:MAG: DUF1533 domain-containing protein, partial [Paludibacter sp.]|nr:DUF1533 domain-containing protein [Paludibacter sp.]
MRKFTYFKTMLLAVMMMVGSGSVWATLWTYDFGSGTGSFTSSTASTSFLPTPTSGTARVRVGTNPGSIVLANPGLASLGTNTELQITSNTGSTSTTKFSIYDYTSGKDGYVKFKIAFSGGTNGVYKFSLGDGANYSDNVAIGTAQIFAGIEWTLGATNTVSYKVLNASTYGTTGISSPTTLFVQSTTTVYSVEVYANNTTISSNYSRSGTSYSLANATWDLWVDGSRVGTGLAKGGLTSDLIFDSFSFNHQTSVTTPGTIYIDDIEYANALPVLLSSPSLTADASSNDVDNNIDITFVDDASWRAAVTAVKVEGTVLTETTDYVLSSGNLQIIPSGLNALLTTSGLKEVTIEATGYTTASLTQQINAGTATKLGMKTQPAAPATNGDVLATQPAVYIQDQYGNTTTSTASVVASVGSGTWTLGGTTSVAAVSGTTTFTGLTATSTAEVTGATIDFTSTGLTPVTSGTFTIATPPAQIDWANLQWPASGTINLGATFNVYTQVYEPGLTDAAGQGAGVQVWIGYSTSNTNPNTWTNWVAATYSSDQGNNDEYVANIGAAITPSGTYYYASRIQLGTALYLYGGYNSGFWDGATNVSGTLTVNPAPTLDWVNLQSPASGSITTAQSFDVYAQVFESGLTEATGQGAGVTAWIGYSTSNTNPNTWTNWVSATFNIQSGNNDEYTATLSGLTAGTYYYASRFKYGLADYVYGGLNGFWDVSTSLSGVLAVSTPEPADHVTNLAATTTAPTYSSVNLTWVDAAGATSYLIKGSAVSYEAITAPVDGISEADGTLVKNVASGAETYTFTGLTGETTYYFKIFPYNGTSTAVNFKTDGSVPQATATTTITPTLWLAEDFNYTAASLLTANGWTAHSGAGTQAIDVTVPGLSFNGYVGSGIGGAALVDNTGEDVNKSFTAQTSGILYIASLIQINANTTAGYFYNLGPNTIGSTFFSRVWVNSSANGINITNGSTAPSSYVSIINGATFMLVLKHNFTTNKTDMFILNSFSATEPITPDATIDETITEIGSVALRQYSAAQNILVDGIRVTTTWSDLPITFTGIGEWSETARWNTASVPGTTQRVVIDGTATINSNVEVAGLTVNSTKSLTVNAGKQLTVSATLTNNGVLNLLSDNTNGTATIITPGTEPIPGTFNISQYLTGKTGTSTRANWYLSSPVSGATANVFNVAGGVNHMTSYDETVPGYLAQFSSNTTALVPGTGYVTYIGGADATYTFTGGSLNNGDVTLTPTRTGTDAGKRGFNLVGNPYPSYLNWGSTDIVKTNVRNTIWYRTWSGSEMIFLTNDGSFGTGTSSAYIPPM